MSIETNQSAAVDRETGFVRELGLFDSVMVTMGVMIGSGIFIVPADMARNIGSAGWLLVAWGIAAVLTVAAALSYGELASMLPRAGGMPQLPSARRRDADRRLPPRRLSHPPPGGSLRATDVVRRLP